MGAVSLYGQGNEGSGRPWSVSAKLRGFYDDNYATAPSDPQGVPGAAESWGVNVAPGVKYTLLRDRTSLTASYDFDLRWYESRQDDEFDFTHRGELALAHSFNERLRFELYDSVVYSEEPSVIEPNGGAATFLRTNGNAWRNAAGTALNAGLTEKLGTRIAYSNTLYDYEESGTASRSALLDRMEHMATADLRWQFQPTVIGLVGYQYGYFDYTSSDYLYYTSPQTAAPTAEARNQQSHYAFIGTDYSGIQGLVAQVRVGFNYADYPNTDADTIFAPFADAALTYEYTKGSKAAIGVKHDLRPTDVAVAIDANDFTTAQEATTLYGFVSHRLGNFIATLRGSWQAGTYQGGLYDDVTDNFYTFDANLAYEFTRFLAAEAGYAYDTLDSDIVNRGYDRNRFYFGVRANY